MMRRILFPALLLYAVLLHGALADGSRFTDEHIVRAAITRINALKLEEARVKVACYNRRILLTGEVPDANARDQAGRAAAVPDASGVSNELAVGPVTGIATRTADSWTANNVKLRLFHNGISRAVPIKVVVEDHTVYLMGVLQRSQGAVAAQVASATRGVRRVVLEFEYLD